MTEIKICGLTCEKDIAAVNQFLPDYVGFVLFFPKSKRNLSPRRASVLKKQLDKKIKTVAVVVSPTKEHIQTIEEIGFDYIQIHGKLTKEIYEQSSIPILRAFAVSDFDQIPEYESKEKIKGFVFDSKSPGSGKTFDWKLLSTYKNGAKILGKKMFLAGGIDETNVRKAISELLPDVIDVSSSVEQTGEDGGFYGKDPEKIKTIVRMVHENEE